MAKSVLCRLIFCLCAASLVYGLPDTAIATGPPALPNQQHGISGSDMQSTRYDRLAQALADYRAIAGRGGWPAIPEGASLQRGMQDAAVRLLRLRLAATGDLEPGTEVDPVFDQAVEAAVHRFQQRHGLADDGIVGPRTRAALNVPVEQRIEQLRINLERRAAMPDDLGPHYIFVNMADFTLKVVRDARTVLTMKIVVGTPYRQTPLFTASMTYIDFNPYWNIPDRIAREEIVPRVRRDPGYLGEQGIRVLSGWIDNANEIAPDRIDWFADGGKSLPYRLRQDPGPLNPLGQVKFMFPNSFEIYLHDSPAKHLFATEVRTFSHGCIRIEKPVSLAAYLLPDLSSDQVRDIVVSGKRRVIHLAKPLTVYLTYLTAWVNKDRSVHFRKDVYGRDRLQTANLP